LCANQHGCISQVPEINGGVMRRNVFILATVLVLAVVGGLDGVGTAVRLEPVATERIVLRLRLGATPARIVVQAGKMATIATPGWPLIGLVANPKGSTLGLVVSAASSHAAVPSQEMAEISRSTIEPGGSLHLDLPGGVLAFEWIETKSPLPPDLPAGECTRCCLTCGESTVCACFVEMSCGFCCCSGVCACDIEDLTGKGSGTRSCAAGPTPRTR
jgi:hypothetical protein